MPGIRVHRSAAGDNGPQRRDRHGSDLQRGVLPHLLDLHAERGSHGGSPAHTSLGRDVGAQHHRGHRRRVPGDADGAGNLPQQHLPAAKAARRVPPPSQRGRVDMKIHSRHVIRGFLGLLLLCICSIVAVFVVVDFVGNTKVWLARPVEDVYRYYYDFLPHILYLILPIAVLLAAVFSVGNMSRHLEIVALRAAGVSVARILSPILISGLVISGCMFWFEDAVLPDANHRRYQINEPKSQDGNQGGDPLEKFNFLYTASDGTILYFDFYSGHKKTGQGITVLSQPRQSPLEMRIDARSLAWDSAGWVLRDGTRRTFGPGTLDALTFKELRFP